MKTQASRKLWAYAAVSLLCMAAFYVWVLAGGVSPYRVEPFGFIYFTVFDPLFPAHSIVRLGLLVGAAIAVYLSLFVPLLGAVWLLRKRDNNGRFTVFSVATATVAVGICTLLAGPGDNETDFLPYGYIVLVPVAALGLTRLWNDTPKLAHRRIVAACAAVLVLGLVAAGSSRVLVSTGALTSTGLIPAAEGAFGFKRLAWGAWYLGVYGLIACVIVLASLTLERSLAPTIRSRGGRVLACCVPLVMTLGLVKPVAIAFPEAWKTIVGRRVVLDTPVDQGMSAALYAGLLWVRGHTPTCSILAVNNHYLQAPARDPRYFYYSAFAERRVFLESWEYPAHWDKRQPFPARMALNIRATSRGESRALRQLALMGVSYVLIDNTHGGGAKEPRSTSRLVFANSALDVYELLVARRDRGSRAGCTSVVGG